MSAPTMDPAAIPDAWRLEGSAVARDPAGDAVFVKRYGDRLVFHSIAERFNFTVAFPVDSAAETLDALESVVREMQAFLEQARNR